jgi:hypothetical protein
MPIGPARSAPAFKIDKILKTLGRGAALGERRGMISLGQSPRETYLAHYLQPVRLRPSGDFWVGGHELRPTTQATSFRLSLRIPACP